MRCVLAALVSLLVTPAAVVGARPGDDPGHTWWMDASFLDALLEAGP
jgi:hypothetical protein